MNQQETTGYLAELGSNSPQSKTLERGRDIKMNDFFQTEEKTVSVELEHELIEVARNYDIDFNGTSKFSVPEFYAPEGEWEIGLIVGQSGSGKSTLLSKHFKVCDPPDWEEGRAIFTQIDEAEKRLCGVGLSSVPSWFKPHHVLSNGERFRADLAKSLNSGMAFDEFTSVVDRDVAKSASHGIQRLIRSTGMKKIVFASCHYDIIDWLKPNWTYDASEGKMLPRGHLQPVEFTIDITPCTHREWVNFSHHHYLSGEINKSSRCWLATMGGRKIGFASSLAHPSGTVKNAWREHRTVVLTEFQGCGIGVKLSDAVAKIHTDQGMRYFSKTSHPRMGEYRERSSLWVGTSKNKKSRGDYVVAGNAKMSEEHSRIHSRRVCYSHEFIGSSKTNSTEESKWLTSNLF